MKFNREAWLEYIEEDKKYSSRDIIHYIFDMIEERVCKNCKWYAYMSINNSYICSNFNNQSVKFVEKDFGCINFQEKEK